MRGNFVISIAMAALAVAALKLSFFENPWSELPISERETIVVEGLGSVTAPHDYAAFTFTVETYADEPAQAMQENNTVMLNVLEQINNLEVPPQDIETKRVRLNTDRGSYYDQPRDQATIYTATNEVRVRFTDLEGIGPAMTAAVNGGATHLNGPQMHLFETDELLARARDLAIEDAQRIASATAAASGLTLRDIIQMESVEYRMSESNFQEYSSAEEFLSSSSAYVEDPTPVRYGRELLTATIRVTFEIE